MEHQFRDAEMALTLAEMRSDVDKLVTKLSVKEAKEAAEAGETVALVSGGDGAAQTTHASEMLMKVTEYVQQCCLGWCHSCCPDCLAPRASLGCSTSTRLECVGLRCSGTQPDCLST